MTSKDLAVPEDSAIPVGLEDYDPNEDGSIPRIRIDMEEAAFVDSLTNESFDQLDVILLGLVKQRILWPANVEEDSKGPLCRSNNHEIGRPFVKEFPWDESGFAIEDVDRDDPALPCAACLLREWGSHPSRDTPWCSETFQFPLLIPAGEELVPAIVQFQRSSIKPARKYVTGFVREKKPLFTKWTTITLTKAKRGKVNYAVPEFTVGRDTDPDDHAEMADQFLSIRGFLRNDAREEAAAIRAVEASSTPAEVPASITPAPAASTDVDPEEEPF